MAFMGNALSAIFGTPMLFLSRPTPESWIWLCIMGVCCTGLSFVIYTIVIKYLKAIEAIIIQTMEPVLNPIWVFLIVREIPGMWSIIGGSVILIAIAFHSFTRSRLHKTAITST